MTTRRNYEVAPHMMETDVEFVVYPRRRSKIVPHHHGKSGKKLYTNTLVVSHRHIFHIPPKINIFDYDDMGIPLRIDPA